MGPLWAHGSLLYSTYMNDRPGGTDLTTLLHAAHAAEHDLETKLGAIGLSLAKLAALKTLAEAGESLPLTQLAERLSCVKSNITQLVDRLEADGLVQRESDPKDRRTKLATLTAAGRKACREGLKVQHVAEQNLLRKLTAAESHALAGLLAKLSAS
jgi:DNA-binding MarR family transcriptional regulator